VLYQKKFISDDIQLQFGFAEYPFWLNPANYDLKWGVIDYFKENLPTINHEPLKVEIQNYIQYLIGTEDTHPDALFYLKNFIKFSNEYNNTILPEQLNYIKKYLKDESEHIV
jgi:hypothetical protein